MGRIRNWRRDAYGTWRNSVVPIEIDVETGGRDWFVFRSRANTIQGIEQISPPLATKQNAEKFAVQWMRQHPNG